jgi:hypothetical protein
LSAAGESEEPQEVEPGLRFTIDREKALEKISDTRIEFAKLHYDWLKHQSTLCTGSILVISALSGSIFAASSFHWGWLILASLVLLLLAILLLTVSMWYWLNWAERTGVFWYLAVDNDHEFAEAVDRIEGGTQQSEQIANRLGLAGSACFILGVVSFCSFALRNASALF